MLRLLSMLPALASLMGAVLLSLTVATQTVSAQPAPIPSQSHTSRASSAQASIAAHGPELRRFLGQESLSARPANTQATVLQPTDVAALAQARHDAERAHLWRVAVWGTLNAAGGLALVLGTGRQEQPAYWGFGAQSGLWGAVNIGIAAAGLAAGGDVSTSYDAALSAERTYHDILLFNLGLNVAYSSVGASLVILSYRGVDSARSLRGHGSSLIMQGAGLLVLDAIAFVGSRTRLAGLLDMVGSISARALPTGFAVAITL